MSSSCGESLGLVNLHTLHVSGRTPLLKQGIVVRVLRDAERTGFGFPFEGVDEGRQKARSYNNKVV